MTLFLVTNKGDNKQMSYNSILKCFQISLNKRECIFLVGTYAKNKTLFDGNDWYLMLSYNAFEDRLYIYIYNKNNSICNRNSVSSRPFRLKYLDEYEDETVICFDDCKFQEKNIVDICGVYNRLEKTVFFVLRGLMSLPARVVFALLILYKLISVLDIFNNI